MAYRQTISTLERRSSFLQVDANRRGLQRGRWIVYVRSARNSLQLHERASGDVSLLIEAWAAIQSGRARALMDLLTDTGATDQTSDVPAWPALYVEVADASLTTSPFLSTCCFPEARDARVVGTSSWSSPERTSRSWLGSPWHSTRCRTRSEAWPPLQRSMTPSSVDTARTSLISLWTIVTRDRSRCWPTSCFLLICSTGSVLEAGGVSSSPRMRTYTTPPFLGLRPVQSGTRAYLGVPVERAGFEVMYAPSASIFATWCSRRRQSPQAQRSAALFVDPLGDLSRDNPDVENAMASVETRLRAAGVFVNRWTGHAATADAWITESCTDDVLIFFGHSVASTEQPEMSSLIFAKGSDPADRLTVSRVLRDSRRGRRDPRLARCAGFVLWRIDRRRRMAIRSGVVGSIDGALVRRVRRRHRLVAAVVRRSNPDVSRTVRRGTRDRHRRAHQLHQGHQLVGRPRGALLPSALLVVPWPHGQSSMVPQLGDSSRDERS